jgi:hypothetical protein
MVLNIIVGRAASQPDLARRRSTLTSPSGSPGGDNQSAESATWRCKCAIRGRAGALIHAYAHLYGTRDFSDDEKTLGNSWQALAKAAAQRDPAA